MSSPTLPNLIAVDFDGTCVTHEYPKIGREIGAVPVLKELVARGCKLILWTMRSDGCEHGDMLTAAVNWFAEHGIPLFGMQRNPEQDTWTTSPKAYAKLYIDDAALGAPLCQGLKGERPFVDWQRVRELLLPAEEADPYESEEYQKFVASVADQCTCKGPVCGGVLAGGLCDNLGHDEIDLEDED